MPRAWKKIDLPYTEDEIRQMTRFDIVQELADKERAYCEYVIRNHNKRQSAIKAGYSPKSAHLVGYKLTNKPQVMLYISWLKLRVADTCELKAQEVIDKYVRIAFADMSDFGEVKNGRFRAYDLDMVDGQLIKSIKQTNNGITYELIDKLPALKKLEEYFDFMPKDWRRDIEEKKLHLLEQKLEIERAKAGLNGEDIEDDGFLKALYDAADNVWEDKEHERED